jgi:hypothetical protein
MNKNSPLDTVRAYVSLGERRLASSLNLPEIPNSDLRCVSYEWATPFRVTIQVTRDHVTTMSMVPIGP